MFLISSCSCLCLVHWSQVLSREWRCSWSSADRWCSNYIWVINKYITHWGVTYIRGLAVNVLAVSYGWHNPPSCVVLYASKCPSYGNWNPLWCCNDHSYAAGGQKFHNSQPLDDRRCQRSPALNQDLLGETGNIRQMYGKTSQLI